MVVVTECNVFGTRGVEYRTLFLMLLCLDWLALVVLGTGWLRLCFATAPAMAGVDPSASACVYYCRREASELCPMAGWTEL